MRVKENRYRVGAADAQMSRPGALYHNRPQLLPARIGWHIQLHTRVSTNRQRRNGLHS